MREKKNHLYVDSKERKLLLHSLVGLKNQLIQQGRYTVCLLIRKKAKEYQRVIPLALLLYIAEVSYIFISFGVAEME